MDRRAWAAVALVTAADLCGACAGAIDDAAGGGGERSGTPGAIAQPGGPNATGPSGGGGAGAGPGARPAAPGPATAACKQGDPGPSPMRRLTRWEYDNTMRDLLGDSSRPATPFPADNRVGAFNNNAEAQGVSALLAQNYMDAAERVVAAAWASVSKQLPCDPATGDAACGAKFVETWGKRVWRRPLDANEKASLGKLFTTTMASGGFVAGIQRTMQAMLQSPQFLYRIETVQPAAAGVAMVKLTSWELASRLSYMLWGSMPDDALFAAAEAGKLNTREDVAAQARRMLEAPEGRRRAREMTTMFHQQWLELDAMDQIEKDAKMFPTFAAAKPLVRKEMETFLDAVIWDGDGTVKALLTAPFSMMNAKLAEFYGVLGKRPAGDTFERVELDPAQRGGLLGQGAFLATHAKPNQTYPPGRGKFVRENLFCQPLPPPADNVKPPEPDPKLTGRERWEANSRLACASVCHTKMDPIGLGFENFDAVGRFRTMENGKPVDGSGELTGTDVDGKFVGQVELGKKVSGSAAVSECLMTQWFWFAYGRPETPQDACTIETLKGAFKASNYSVRELLVALAQTDAFLYRRGGAP